MIKCLKNRCYYNVSKFLHNLIYLIDVMDDMSERKKQSDPADFDLAAIGVRSLLLGFSVIKNRK